LLTTGSGNANLLIGSDDLPVGDVGAVLLTVNACGCPDGSSIMNSATISADAPGGSMLTDDSVKSGTTDVTLTQPTNIGLAKRVVETVQNQDGSTDITYEFNIQNYGSVELDSIQVTDDLSTAFNPCTGVSIVSLTSDDFIVNQLYQIFLLLRQMVVL